MDLFPLKLLSMGELSILLQVNTKVAGTRKRAVAESNKAHFPYILAGRVNVILADEVAANPVSFPGTCVNTVFGSYWRYSGNRCLN